MAVQNLANHPFHNGLNPTALLHSYSGHSYSEMKLFWGAKGVTLLTSDYMAACGRSRDTLVPALLVPETSDRLPGMLLANARQNSGAQKPSPPSTIALGIQSRFRKNLHQVTNEYHPTQYRAAGQRRNAAGPACQARRRCRV